MSRQLPRDVVRDVVIASRVYAPEPAAAALRLRVLAQALHAAGVRVRVLTSRAPEGSNPPSDVQVRRWPVRRDAAGAVRGWIPYLSFDVPLALRLLLTRRVDVVVVEPPPTTGVVVRLVCLLRRRPYVYYAADVLSSAVGPGDLPARLHELLRRVEGWAMAGASAVLTVSDDVAREIESLGVPAGRVHVVGTGVDTSVFTPLEAATSQTLVYAGTMSELHGAEVFVRALGLVADELPELRLLMLGGGTSRPGLQRLAEQLVPGRVEFRGVVPPQVVAAELSAAVAGLASLRPGTGYVFATAVKTFAATGCGAPVIYSGAGPAGPSVAENRLGWAVPWEPAAVADAIRAAAAAERDPDERARRAQWTHEHMSLAAVAARAVQVVLGKSATN